MPRPLSPLPALLALALVVCGCQRCAPEPQPPLPHLARVPDGYGELYGACPVLKVRERRLVLPSGRSCGVPADEGCARELEGLRGESLALDLEAGLLMADLSDPFALLAAALEKDDQACLMVADSRSIRCLPFRPMSGEQFGAWLDAERPLGKIRLVMRADGIEVVADRGKVPGPDRYGPSLPPVGGKHDFAGLEPLTRALAARFPDEDQAAVVPSPRTSLADAARALASLSGLGAERFSRTFLVYP